MLDSNKCYMLDGGAEIFVWMGRNTSLTERKMSISVIEVRKFSSLSPSCMLCFLTALLAHLHNTIRMYV